jgi:hypothetical protein
MTALPDLDADGPSEAQCSFTALKSLPRAAKRLFTPLGARYLVLSENSRQVSFGFLGSFIGTLNRFNFGSDRIGGTTFRVFALTFRVFGTTFRVIFTIPCTTFRVLLRGPCFARGGSLEVVRQQQNSVARCLAGAAASRIHADVALFFGATESA